MITQKLEKQVFRKQISNRQSNITIKKQQIKPKYKRLT